MTQQPDLHAHLRASYNWIERSCSPRSGGARAYYTPLRGWGKTYPQVTGCLIPTVLRIGTTLGSRHSDALARRFGDYLLDIQHPEGAWHGGMWPARRSTPLNHFTTAQIVQGLCALSRHTGDSRWIDSANRAASWIARTLEGESPAYYTQISWPLLELWSISGDEAARDCAVRILDDVMQQRTLLGAFRRWGFGGSDSAFTHTIGFTLRGLVESAILLDAWPRYGKPIVSTLRRLADDALAANGRLPGAYDVNWKCDRSYTCLTGNAQIALCLLKAPDLVPERRFVPAARALIEEIARRQWREHPIPGLRGAIPGSYPVWGRYLTGRYPIWAAKYFSDAIVALSTVDQGVFRLADSRAVAPNAALTPT